MKTNPLIELSVIIINYNTADFLFKCLNAIASQSEFDAEVIVVDNASADGSQHGIKNHFPWVKLIANAHNMGFARANNQALNICRGRYIYFLNPDTQMEQGDFKIMIQYMETHPEVGLAGTRIVNPDGSFQSSVERRYPGQRYAKQELQGLRGDIAWVLGASMIARGDVIRDLGGFDERFFLYGEDLDLCLRMRKAGWLIGYIPNTRLVHWGGQSERMSLPVEVWQKKLEAEAIFFEKHYTKGAVRAIRRASLIQAFWRIFTLKLCLPFCADKETSLDKLNKYKVVLNTSLHKPLH